MRVLREHALCATDVNAIGCAHGTAHRVAYSSPNSAADSNAERCANIAAYGFADGAAYVAAYGFADGAANIDAYGFADGAAHGDADSSPNVPTNATAVSDGVYDCIRHAGGNVRSRSRRQLLRKSSRVRGG